MLCYDYLDLRWVVVYMLPITYCFRLVWLAVFDLLYCLLLFCLYLGGWIWLIVVVIELCFVYRLLVYCCGFGGLRCLIVLCISLLRARCLLACFGLLLLGCWLDVVVLYFCLVVLGVMVVFCFI